jgi:indole-3-acetate monooxygenase
MDLAQTAARYADEAERERQLPDELVKALAEAGVFRLLVPRAVGGREEHPRVLVETVEQLARADGSVGWCAAIGSTSGIMAGYLPPETAQEIYGSATSISGGVFAPVGKATRAEGGYRITGRWRFASGCTYCDWLMGGCLVEGDPRPVPRLVLAPASDVEIHDTWDAMGLRGTGSHDIEMNDLFVPQTRQASLVVDRPTATGPLYAFPVFGLLALAIGAVNLGIARGALDDVIALAGERTPTGSSRTMAERPTVQAELGAAEARLQAARSLLLQAVDEAWAPAAEKGEVPVAQRASLRLAATHAATTGAEVTCVAYHLAGGASVYESSGPLPRRFRDANTATQHMLVGPTTNELAGRLLLRLPTDASQL